MSAARRSLVMLLSWAIPPNSSGSSIIVGNLARQFSADEMVVVGERNFSGPSQRWDPAWPKLLHVVRGWPYERRGARWFRWAQIPWLMARCLAIARTRGARTIIAVFPKEEFLLAGYLTAIWTGARFFPYFHNAYLENRKGAGRWLAHRLQSRVFERAERVLVISEGLAELYRRRYPGVELVVVPHSFNEDVPGFVPPPPPGAPVQLVLSGNINESCRDAAVRVAQAVAQHPDARLQLLSGTAPSVLARLDMLHANVRHATVTREVLLSELSGADIVVLPHGLSGAAAPEEYQTIFPTRTIEYLICGRPILAHAPANCFLTRFLKEHDCALVVDEPDCAAIVNAIEQLRTNAGLRNRLVRNALAAANKFRAQRVAGILRDLLQTTPVTALTGAASHDTLGEAREHEPRA